MFAHKRAGSELGGFRKLLGVLALALAVLAVAAPIARATPELQAGQYPATTTGAQVESQKLAWSMDGSKVTCESVTLQGSLGEAATSFTAQPAFTGCTVFGFLSGTVTATGCEFEFSIGEETSAHHHLATADLVCSESNKVKFVAGTCEAQVGSQSLGGEVELVDNTEATPRKDVTAELNLKAITFNATKDGFLCPLSGTGERSTGTLVGAYTLTAENPSTPAEKFDLSVSD